MFPQIKAYATVILLGLSGSCCAAQTLFAEGRAFQPDSQTLLYSEKHFLAPDNSHIVVYYEPDGREFARKTLYFNESLTAPLLTQENARVGEKILITAADNEQLKVFYKKSEKNNGRESFIEMTDSLVVDAGFDNFVKNHWHKLMAGEVMDVDYLLPTRGKTFDLMIKKVKCDKPTLCLAIAPKNRLLGLFSDQITLEYDLDSKKLLTFSGKANIADALGKYRKVTISYTHFTGVAQGHLP